MIQDDIARNLQERTGRHFCTQCLREIPDAEYFGNDFLCLDCAGKSGDFPFASTPGHGAPDPRGRDQGQDCPSEPVDE